MSLQNQILAPKDRCLKLPSQSAPPAHPRYSPNLRIHRHCALGFIALSLAVFFWGFGSKLSLYKHHCEAGARTSIARMWVEPRDTAALNATRARLRSHSTTDQLVLHSARPRQAVLMRTTADGVLMRRMHVSFAFLLPFRSPPALLS